MKVIVFILVALLALLQWRLWFSAVSVGHLAALNRSISVQGQENDSLEQRNRLLEVEVNDLKNGLAAIEERARSELGMIGKNEVFYLVVD